MRKTPFPATIPVIDLVAGNAPPVQVFDSVKEARWRGHYCLWMRAFIFRDNRLLAVSAIVKAYVGTLRGEQGNEIMKRFLSYSLEAANDQRRMTK